MAGGISVSIPPQGQVPLGGQLPSSFPAPPSMKDPLGQLPDPSSFGAMMEAMVDARIAMHNRFRTQAKFDGVTNQELILELVARGYAVFKPSITE